MKKKVNFKLAEILVALLGVLILGFCIQDSNNFAGFSNTVNAKPVKGD